MVTYDMLFNSSLTNLEKITEQRNKLIMVNQRDLPKSLRWRHFWGPSRPSRWEDHLSTDPHEHHSFYKLKASSDENFESYK